MTMLESLTLVDPDDEVGSIKLPELGSRKLYYSHHAALSSSLYQEYPG